MLTDRSIVTVNQAKEYLGILTTNTTKDTLLESWIDIVSGRFEAQIENKVMPQEVTVYLDGNGDSKLRVPYYPVIEVTSLQGRMMVTDEWADYYEEMTYVHLDPQVDYIELLDGEYFDEGQKNVKLVYMAGFSPVPGDITQTVLEMLAQMWRESRQGDGTLGLSSLATNAASGSTNLSMFDLSDRWNQVVRRYMNRAHGVEEYR